MPEVLKRVRGIELRYYMVSAHYRSHVEFSFEALDEAALGFRRIETFLERARQVAEPDGRPASHADQVSDAFAAAMDDDLGTPAAIGVIHDAVREGNTLLADGDVRPLSATLRSCAMLDVLGLDPADPAFAPRPAPTTRSSPPPSTRSSPACSRSGPPPAPTRTGPRADAIRDRIAAAGIEVEDTPDGPKWTVR